MMLRCFILLILLLFQLSAFAQDGVSPDTLLTFANGFGYYETGSHGTWLGAWTGTLNVPYGSCDTGYVANSSIGVGIGARANYELSVYSCQRGFAMFNTVDLISTQQQIDSCKIMLPIDHVTMNDGDSLWAVEMAPIDTSDCAASESHLDIWCNYYRCGTLTYPVQAGDGYVIPSTGWNSIWFDKDYLDLQDTTVIGLVTRRVPGSAPTGANIFYADSYANVGDSIAMLVYYYSRKYNDISHQNNADGISPDTLNFICSQALDEIRTPGYWRHEWIPTWNASPSVALDCFHGHIDSAYGCGDTSRTSSYWNRGPTGQPQITATQREAPYNDYKMCRAYFLGEIETPIPDTDEMDSMKFSMKFGSAKMYDGDSLHFVTYTPHYSADGLDCCYVCYGCDYPPLHPPSGWCNFWSCGDHNIWGEAMDRSLGKTPVYLLTFDFYGIHPSVIDFSSISVGDTFGIGMVFRFEGDAAPTDTNECNILAGANCPYIVYWFSERASEDGFINWGVPAHHSNYGLPIQARRMYGGGKGR